MSLEHARHNKSACEFLNTSGNFGDWVITTAYYSALHYFQSSLFPGQFESPLNGQISNFTSFNQYYNSFSDKRSKHGLLLNLVEEYVDDSDVIDAFTSLKDLCWTARYTNYCCDVNLVQDSISSLEIISEYCEPIDVESLKN